MIEKMARLNKSISRFFICGAAIFSASIFLGCDRRPKEVLSEKEMVSLMADMQLAEACLNSSAVSVHSRDGRLELGRSVLAAHGVTQEQLDTTLDGMAETSTIIPNCLKKWTRRLLQGGKN